MGSVYYEEGMQTLYEEKCGQNKYEFETKKKISKELENVNYAFYREKKLDKVCMEKGNV